MATKKNSRKKSVKKSAKKTAKKSSKKALKKSAKKPVKKAAKKPVKKAAKKPVKKATKKSVKKAAKKIVKKAAKKKSPRPSIRAITKKEVPTRSGSSEIDEGRRTVLNEFIDVPNNEDSLFVSMLIGDINQAGSTRVEIANDPDFPPKNFDGTFNKIPIAPCSQMDGKVLLLVTSVTDTNGDPDNNKLEATITIHAGNSVKLREKLQAEVKEGGTETFIFNITCHVS